MKRLRMNSITWMCRIMCVRRVYMLATREVNIPLKPPKHSLICSVVILWHLKSQKAFRSFII